MKETEILNILESVHKLAPFRVKQDGTKCWKHRGHTVEIGPSTIDPADFVIRRTLVIDGRKVQVNWERLVDSYLLKK